MQTSNISAWCFRTTFHTSQVVKTPRVPECLYNIPECSERHIPGHPIIYCTFRTDLCIHLSTGTSDTLQSVRNVPERPTRSGAFRMMDFSRIHCAVQNGRRVHDLTTRFRNGPHVPDVLRIPEGFNCSE